MAYRSILFAALLAAIAAALVTGSLAERGPNMGEPREPRVIADVSTERLLPYGPVVGFTNDRGVHAWLGIPYAAHPSGPDRWRVPSDPEPWVQTFDALAPAPACAQPSRLPGESAQMGPAVLGREGCLTLSVWSPIDAASSAAESTRAVAVSSSPREGERPLGLRPVMVWVNDGSPHVDPGQPVDGSELAAREGVVVVSIQYRLGVLGFFSHPALADPDTRLGNTGNFGTLDLVKGLEWVRDHAALFGGDPENVTIFGESDGATQVMALLLAPRARGLFHRAIVQGGSLDMASSHDPSEEAIAAGGVAGTEGDSDAVLDPADAFVALLLQLDGTVASEADARRFAAGLGPSETAEYLRSRSVRDVLAASDALARRDPVRGRPRPVGDGVVLPVEPPLERLRSEELYNAVPIILGSNRDDAKLDLAHDPGLVRNVFDRFYQARDPERYDEVARLATALQRANGVDEPASALHHAQGPSVWVYRFDWDEHPAAFGTDLRALLGAGHGLEVPFVFGQFRAGPSQLGHRVFDEANGPSRQRLSNEMMSYWAEFAWRGAPGRGRRGELPEWLPWDEAGHVPGRFLVFDSVAGGGVRMAKGKITSEDVLAELVASTDLAAADKCLVLRRLRLQAPTGLDLRTREAVDARSRLCREFVDRTL